MWRTRACLCRVGDSFSALQGLGLNLSTPTAGDKKCVEYHQLGRPDMRFRADMVAVGERCRHGFPQAFMFNLEGKKLHSGIFRLSCPLLVKAIDEWEAEGAVRELNRRAVAETAEGDSWRATLPLTNAAHSTIRRAGIRESLLATHVEKKGAETVELVMGSGLAGITPGSNDVKCLHAQVGDHLCRNRAQGSAQAGTGPEDAAAHNTVGAAILHELQTQRGCEVKGNSVCVAQCSGCGVSGEAGDFASLGSAAGVTSGGGGGVAAEGEWVWYRPVKNKQKNAQTRERRRKLAAAKRERGEAGAATHTNSPSPRAEDW